METEKEFESDDQSKEPQPPKMFTDVSRLFPKEPNPDKIEKQILDKNGETCGEWIGLICRSPEDIPIREIEWETIFSEVPEGVQWPIAYLPRLFIQKSRRLEGLGKSSLEDFRRWAVDRGAAVAIVWVGRQLDEELESNISFFRSTGWTFFFKDDPHGVDLAFKKTSST